MSKHQEIIDWINQAPIEQLSSPEVKALLQPNLTRGTFVANKAFWKEALNLEDEVDDTNNFLEDGHFDEILASLSKKLIEAKIQCLSDIELGQLAGMGADALKTELKTKAELGNHIVISDEFASYAQKMVIKRWIRMKIGTCPNELFVDGIIQDGNNFNLIQDVQANNPLVNDLMLVLGPAFTAAMLNKVKSVEVKNEILAAAKDRKLYLWALNLAPNNRYIVDKTHKINADGDNKNILLRSPQAQMRAINETFPGVDFDATTSRDAIKRGFAERVRLDLHDLNRDVAQSAFNADKFNITELHLDISSLKSLDSTLRSRLIEFNKIPSFAWLSPLYASTLTLEKIQEYEKLKAKTEIIVDNLKEKKWQLEFYLESLPAKGDVNGSLQSQVESRRTKLEKSLAIVNAELKIYEPALVNLDDVIPFAKKAVNPGPSKDVVIVSTISTFEDRPNAQKANCLKQAFGANGTKVKEDDLLHVAVGPDAERIDLPEGFKDIPKDSFREYVVHACADNAAEVEIAKKGVFIEERKTTTRMLVNKTLTHKVEPLILTAVKWPTAPPTPDDNTIRDIEGAKVDMAMAMASQLLVSLKTKPSKEHPIVISSGGSPEQAKYLWTALMVIGENDPNMRFDKSAIKVNHAGFNPKNELGYFNRFKEDSCLETCFKKVRPNLLEALSEVKAVNAARFNPAEQKVLDFAADQKLFKQKLGKTVEAMDAANKAQNRP